MIKKLTICLLILVNYLGFSQKESANWYFGDFAGISFKTGVPIPLLNGQLVTKEGCTSISDVKGNLLFYTDGITVWDRKHQVMPNGTGLFGHVSSTESAIIIPKPGSRLIYYVFTVDRPSYFISPDDPIVGVNYTEVDLSLNNGLGDVVVKNKNTHLVTYDVNNAIQLEFKSSEKISAVSHYDGSAVWVLTQFINTFYAFKIDASGVNINPVISQVPESVEVIIGDNDVNLSAIGYMKISPNGSKIAIAHSTTSIGSPRSGRKPSGKVLLYDFNNSNGAVSNEKLIINKNYPYGLEFSPNSKLLYVTLNESDSENIFIKSYVHQYNLQITNIASSVYTIKESRNVAGALQLALDAKIYRAGYEIFRDGGALSVINNPNNIGAAANYGHNSIDLGGKTTQIGLPIFVQSIFLASFDYENTCIGDSTHFYITSEEPFQTAKWDFGDGTISDLVEPYHEFSQPGVYKVSLTLTINGIELEPFFKEVIIGEPINVSQDILDLVQCDSFDSDSDDDVATFNLELAVKSLIFDVAEPVQTYYYHTKEDAINDETNTHALSSLYRNRVTDELIYAKIYRTNTDCYSIGTMRLATVSPVDIEDQTLNTCVPKGELLGVFDLNQKAEDLKISLNLSPNSNITFHESLEDASFGIKKLPTLYSSGDKTVYVRVENENICYGVSVLNLELKPFPLVEDKLLKVCLSDFPVLIDSGIELYQEGKYEYTWSTNEVTNSISVDKPGEYVVNINDPVLECGTSITVVVKENEIPIIENTNTDGSSLTILTRNSEETFVYSVDDIGNYQENNFFMNLSPGLHTAYAADINQCEYVQKEFYILGFPKYFTPNGDGYNDTWNPYGLNPDNFDSGNVSIKIFNRYGKLLKVFNPFQSNGWDGKIGNKLLSADDYWYQLKLTNGKEYVGHFALKI